MDERTNEEDKHERKECVRQSLGFSSSGTYCRNVSPGVPEFTVGYRWLEFTGADDLRQAAL